MKNNHSSHQESLSSYTAKQIVLETLQLPSNSQEAANGLYTLFQQELPAEFFPPRP